MVAATEQGEVVEVGGSAAGPVVQVVGVGPRGGPVAAGEDAAAVAVCQGAALGGGDDAAAPAEVEDLGAAAHEDAADGGVAAEPQRGLGGDRGLGALFRAQPDAVTLIDVPGYNPDVDTLEELDTLKDSDG